MRCDYQNETDLALCSNCGHVLNNMKNHIRTIKEDGSKSLDDRIQSIPRARHLQHHRSGTNETNYVPFIVGSLTLLIGIFLYTFTELHLGMIATHPHRDLGTIVIGIGLLTISVAVLMRYKPR